MRFFTLEAYNHWSQHYDDEALQKVFDSYTRHLHSMESVLPTNVIALAKQPGVDDGLIVSVQHDRKDRVLKLTMRCGDLQMGYYDLCITYEGVSLLPEHDWMLAYIARNQTVHLKGRTETAGELAYHEVDSAENGRIEHRLLFHPGRWFGIQCDALSWSQTPQKDRKLPPRLNRYPTGPSVSIGVP